MSHGKGDFNEEEVENLLHELEQAGFTSSPLAEKNAHGSHRSSGAGLVGQSTTTTGGGRAAVAGATEKGTPKVPLTSFSTYGNTTDQGARGGGPGGRLDLIGQVGEYHDAEDDVRRVRVRGNEPLLAPLHPRPAPPSRVGDTTTHPSSGAVSITGFLPPISTKNPSNAMERSTESKPIRTDVRDGKVAGGAQMQPVSPTGNNRIPSVGAATDAVPREATTQQAEVREVNFLPVMCARFEETGGIAPHARWGHTLTAVGDDTVLLFGGHEGGGNTGIVNSLFELRLDQLRVEVPANEKTILWEPAFVSNKGQAPTPRYYHAAASYQGRWLIVSGGTGSTGPLGDLFSFDTQTREWRRLWKYGQDTAATDEDTMGAATPKSGGKARGSRHSLGSSAAAGGSLPSTGKSNEPYPRFGHSIVIRDDRLYLFGGKGTKDEGSGGGEVGAQRAGASLCSSDIYVFDLVSLRWKKRLRSPPPVTGTDAPIPVADDSATGSGSSPKKKSRNNVAPPPTGEEGALAATYVGSAPPPRRAHHAACLLNGVMYINGGEKKAGEVCSDTWGYNFQTKQWQLVHTGTTADACPREKHSLFGCGEALLAIGGCSGGEFSGRLAARSHSFLAVLPINPSDDACWIPVALGNGSLAVPSRKSFGAAFSGGFVYVFGGAAGMEAPGNTLLRFLATDGDFSEADRAATAMGLRRASANAELRVNMKRLRDACSLRGPNAGGTGCSKASHSLLQQHDVFIVPGGNDGGDANRVGVHRALLQLRAPRFLDDLKQCRNVAAKEAAGADDGELLLPSTQAKESVPAPLPVYWAEGNSRVRGLAVPMDGVHLSYLLDYIYTGSLSKDLVHMCTEVEDGAEDEDATTPAAVPPSPSPAHKSSCEAEGRGVAEPGPAAAALGVLAAAAVTYGLPHLAQLCESLNACPASNKKRGSSSAGERRAWKRMFESTERASEAQLVADLTTLLDSASGSSMTVLFVDPHTSQSMTHSLHPFIVANASRFFAELLRPLLLGEKQQSTLRGVTAKIGGTSGAARRRGIIVGPIPVPSMAVQPILRYVYTQQLLVPREAAFTVLMGAHALGAFALQAHCESIVAREEVNYETCCTFLSVAEKYCAPILAELSLVTAVTGYAEVRLTTGFQQLRPLERQRVEEVSRELGSADWRPPQVQTEIKDPEIYSTRLRNA